MKLTTFKFASLLIGLSIFGSSAFIAPSHAIAHEGGHDDGSVQAPKGGDIKGIEDAYIEVLNQGSDVAIYLYSKDLKPIKDLKRFTITAEAQLPRTKIMAPLVVTMKNDSYVTSFDAKGAHRYSLILKVKDAQQTHSDRLQYTIEPRK